MLCLSVEITSRVFVQKKCCPSSAWPLPLPHLVLSHSVITNNAWLAVVVGDLHINPLSSEFLHLCGLKLTKRTVTIYHL